MERFLKLLDEIDDLLVLCRVQAPGLLVTVALLAAFLALLGTVLVFGPPDLLAAP